MSARRVTARNTAELVARADSASGRPESGTPVQPAPSRAKNDPEVTSHTGDATAAASAGLYVAHSFVMSPSGPSKSSLTRAPAPPRGQKVASDAPAAITATPATSARRSLGIRGGAMAEYQPCHSGREPPG